MKIVGAVTGKKAKIDTDAVYGSALAQELVDRDLVCRLVKDLEILSFEAKKDAAAVVKGLLQKDERRKDPATGEPQEDSAVLVYFCGEGGFAAVEQLVAGYCKEEAVALKCGVILRESLRNEAVADRVINSELLWRFFDEFVNTPQYAIGSDAFNILRDLLTRHKDLVAGFMEENYEKVFKTYYNKLLNSENYVTRRQSLKLLGELLLDRKNYNTMIKYIQDKENLKIIMNLLRNKFPNIQFEAFHVFKVFVANPNKGPEVLKILSRNATKLVKYLSTFHADKEEDEQFKEEKDLLISTLQKIEQDAAAQAAEAQDAQDAQDAQAAEPRELSDASTFVPRVLSEEGEGKNSDGAAAGAEGAAAGGVLDAAAEQLEATSLAAGDNA
jgi:calcium binding protein 39